MLIRLKIIVISILFITTWVNGCSLSGPKRSQSFWDLKKFQRTRHPSDCNCGLAQGASSVPWNVYVHTTTSPSNVKTCTGTIINSNTVVTSHKCLLLDKDTPDKQRMRLVDILDFKDGSHSIASAGQVKVTSKKGISASDSINFPVETIWYNPHFAVSSEINGYPENDMALIKISNDFLSSPDFRPICVPSFEQGAFENDKFQAEGYFYGYGKTETLGGNNASAPAPLKGLILKKSVCSRTLKGKKSTEADKFTFAKTFCLKFKDGGMHQNEGGPLIVTSTTPDNPAFLLGITTDFGNIHSISGMEASEGYEYAYFSSINPLIKFIEYFASLDAKTSWCNTPELKLTRLNEENGQGSGGRDAEHKWPWDDLQLPVVRDESLNCLCGEQNTRIGGRVVGGVDATPREFGWMAVLSLYQNGKTGGEGSLCGGSVINDRLILTAAHCVVVDKWLHDDRPVVSIAPENVVVTLNAHLRQHDPLGVEKEISAVLFHPEYVNANRDGFYDFDVALLVLKEPLVFPTSGSGIRPICLPKIGEPFETVGKNAWVVGWGLTDPNDRNSAASKLQKLEIPIANLSFCSDVATSRVTDNFLCAGTLNMYKDAAAGDSGGPLQIEDVQESQWYEVGAVSWGEDVKTNTGEGQEILTAALYADLQKLMPFIDYHAKRVHAQWCKSKRSDTTTTAKIVAP